LSALTLIKLAIASTKVGAGGGLGGGGMGR
jgi:hypothetical protein